MSIAPQPQNPELYVIVSVAFRDGKPPIIHSWGEGLVVDNGKPYTDKQRAQRERRKAIRETARRGESSQTTWKVCKVLGHEASYVDDLGIGRAL